MTCRERRRGLGTRFLLVGALLASTALFLPLVDGAAAVDDAPSITKSVTAKRVLIEEDGTTTEISSNDVKLSVSQTDNLRGRQELRVAWEGAVPTRALTTNITSSAGKDQEYPFVLLQCRGVDTDGAVPPGQAKLRPETCWTQTTSERYVAGGSSTPAWRFDAFAPADRRTALVDTPNPWPKDACGAEPQSSRWLRFAAANGTEYLGGPDPDNGCIKQAPESADTDGGLPSNTTYGITGKDGKGRADFAVWSNAENASLGCAASVDCALVAVPIVGLSCDAWGHKLPESTVQSTKAGAPLSPTQLEAGNASCSATGKYQPGDGSSVTTTDAAVRGAFWWSESNWRNRITVPLKFAETGAVCATSGKDKPLRLIGSVAVNELATSWRPTFCTDKSLFNFTHIQQSDSLARSVVNSGQMPGGFTSAPASGSISRPVVQAPLTMTGFAIAFTIDDADHERQESLNLNARLVAKLLTQSYPAASFVKNNREGLRDNPMNISVDPEFIALNPGLLENSSKESAATLQNLSSNADLIWALTSWLNADAEARAWLDGAPDPWGMLVNPDYTGIQLPIDSWPLRDEFEPPDNTTTACYRSSPAPYLQLVANPNSLLSSILLNMQFGISSVRTGCAYDGQDVTGLVLRQEGAQPVGFRFVLGLATLSAAERYNLRTASLQTRTVVPPGATFENAKGRTFVAGDRTSLREAAAMLKPDSAGTQWNVDYDALETPDGSRAYPGALPVYTTVPTEGLEKDDSAKLATFLCYSLDRGQTRGLANGQLPPGYLPITTANGLHEQREYLVSAIAAVRAQAGDVPKLDAAPPDVAAACSPPKKAPRSTPTPEATTPAPAAVPVAPVVDIPVPAPIDEPVPVEETDVVASDIALTAGDESLLGNIGMPVLLAAALLAGLVGVLLRWLEPLQALGRDARRLWTDRHR